MRFEADSIGGDYAKPRHLRDGEIDEDDAALQHKLAQRHMRREHENAGEKSWQKDIEDVARHRGPFISCRHRHR